METSAFIQYLLERFRIEYAKRDRSGVYGFTQRLMAYNSNKEVPEKMDELLSWYNSKKISLEILAEFHARYESIHPFQDGNGRTGRLILFQECLRNQISLFIIEDANRPEYLDALKAYRQDNCVTKLTSLFRKEQEYYWNRCQYFL